MLRKQLLAAAVASVFSVASFAADGTYTAAAQGQVGPVPVTVTVQKGFASRQNNSQIFHKVSHQPR